MAKHFELFYGAPGSAKTRSIIELVKKVNTDTGKIARVYTGDGSGILYNLAMETGLLPQGSVELMDFIIRPYPFTTLQQISEGMWPEEPLDPKSKMVRLTPKQVADTGMYIFEGAAVAGNYMLGDSQGGLAQRAADGETIGQDANMKFTDSPDYKFGGNSPAHYGLAQRHLLQDILRTKAFPGEFVIWSTHERVDDGERSAGLGPQAGKNRIDDKGIGPEIIGKAMTASVSREYGNTLHFCTATKKVSDGMDDISGKTTYKDKTEYRVYTRDHYDPDGIVSMKYKAINRAVYPQHIEDYYVSTAPGSGLLDFYADLKKANTSQ